jgi:hypothetical protein
VVDCARHLGVEIDEDKMKKSYKSFRLLLKITAAITGAIGISLSDKK